MFCYYSKLLDIILYKTSAEGVIVRNFTAETKYSIGNNNIYNIYG